MDARIATPQEGFQRCQQMVHRRQQGWHCGGFRFEFQRLQETFRERGAGTGRGAMPERLLQLFCHHWPIAPGQAFSWQAQHLAHLPRAGLRQAVQHSTRPTGSREGQRSQSRRQRPPATHRPHRRPRRARASGPQRGQWRGGKRERGSETFARQVAPPTGQQSAGTPQQPQTTADFQQESVGRLQAHPRRVLCGQPGQPFQRQLFALRLARQHAQLWRQGIGRVQPVPRPNAQR